MNCKQPSGPHTYCGTVPMVDSHRGLAGLILNAFPNPPPALCCLVKPEASEGEDSALSSESSCQKGEGSVIIKKSINSCLYIYGSW